MPEYSDAILAVLAMAFVTYATRIGGVLIAAFLGDNRRLRGVLEVLPGCAIVALLAPAMTKGTPAELVALGITLLVMWFTNRVLLATVIGLTILLLGGHFSL